MAESSTNTPHRSDSARPQAQYPSTPLGRSNPATPGRRRCSAPALTPSAARSATVDGSLESFAGNLLTAGAVIRVEFFTGIDAVIVRVLVPLASLRNAPPVTRGVIPGPIELGRITLFTSQVEGPSRPGYFAVRTRLELVALERQFANVAVPETVVFSIVNISEPALLEDEGLARQPTSFASLNQSLQQAVRNWCERHGASLPDPLSNEITIPRNAPLARSKNTSTFLKGHNVFPRSPEGHSVINYIISQEVRRFRKFIERNSLYEQSTDLLQRFQQLFNETLAEATARNSIRPVSEREDMESRIWVKFDLNGVIERPDHASSRTRARFVAGDGGGQTDRDVRNRLDHIDWELAQDVFCKALPRVTVTTVNRRDSAGRMTSVTTVNNVQNDPETPATSRITNRLTQFGIGGTPPPGEKNSPSQSTSPTQISFYADTDCRSAQSPTEYAEYQSRHARARRHWPDAARASCNEEREVSPGLEYYQDQNRLYESDMPFVSSSPFPITSVLSGIPGGINTTDLRNLGYPLGPRRSTEVKRRLNAASYRSPLANSEAPPVLRRFPTPEPYQNRRVLQEIDPEMENNGDEMEVVETEEEETTDEDEMDESESETDDESSDEESDTSSSSSSEDEESDSDDD
ncbi:hypothetical protein TWF730_006283 [Orbilia blumenaviensis]|uniref:Uncharacterized protein n=1 Tax=Orbilia blumenaviensis TaxID=1796055 RepID=A0AAV9VK50_9PEZI